MTGLEIVAATLDWQKPERVARTFWDSDIEGCWYDVKTHDTPWALKGNEWYRTDTWGNIWKRIDDSSKGEVVKGILDDIDEIYSYQFPDFSNPKDYMAVKENRCKYQDKWLVGYLPGFTFKIASELFKLDNYLVNLLLEPEKIHDLHDGIDKVLEVIIKNYATAGVNSVFFWEDWGTQHQLLISPELWRREFYLRFKKLCNIAHECGIRVFMHSCGKISAIVPELIKAGIDVLQFDQPMLHGIEQLAHYQAENKITFWCPVDIQRTLQSGDEQTIRDGAKQMLDKLWKGRGGFIAGFYSDNASIGLDPEWQEFACDEFVRQGRQGVY